MKLLMIAGAIALGLASIPADPDPHACVVAFAGAETHAAMPEAVHAKMHVALDIPAFLFSTSTEGEKEEVAIAEQALLAPDRPPSSDAAIPARTLNLRYPRWRQVRHRAGVVRLC